MHVIAIAPQVMHGELVLVGSLPCHTMISGLHVSILFSTNTDACTDSLILYFLAAAMDMTINPTQELKCHATYGHKNI